MTDATLANIRRAARGPLPERCELCGREDMLQGHHVGGRRYGGVEVRVCKGCHDELSRAQSTYTHLLALNDPPAWVVDMVLRLDLAAVHDALATRGRLRDDLLQRLALAERERVRDDLAPRLCDPGTREMLRRHRGRKSG